MNQQQREWNIFGQVLTTSDLSIYILMLVALLSGVAGIWLGPLVNVILVASIADYCSFGMENNSETQSHTDRTLRHRGRYRFECHPGRSCASER